MPLLCMRPQVVTPCVAPVSRKILGQINTNTVTCTNNHDREMYTAKAKELAAYQKHLEDEGMTPKFYSRILIPIILKFKACLSTRPHTL